MRGRGAGRLTAVLGSAVVVGAVVAGAIGFGVLGVPATATAATPMPGGAEVSVDGFRFADGLDQPLFDHPPVIVPGDTISSTLWVKNAGETPAVLRLSGTDAWSSSPVFADRLLVSAGARDDGGEGTSTVSVPIAAAPLPIGQAADCALLFAGPVLQPGATMALTVTVYFDPAASGLDAQDAVAGFDLVAGLRDPGESAGPAADCSGGSVLPVFPETAGPTVGRAERMAATGLPAVLISMGAAVLLVAGFSALAGVRLRRGTR
ncbi:hypothetical protein [Herbiconiux solani]|uniref:hypothetical protein n=1 Tax=Herbiconiux solani TaxID=661329 RepID=UPI0012EDDF28|nr:hypothetical protein [Herbiconiux solani]